METLPSSLNSAQSGYLDQAKDSASWFQQEKIIKIAGSGLVSLVMMGGVITFAGSLGFLTTTVLLVVSVATGLGIAKFSGALQFEFLRGLWNDPEYRQKAAQSAKDDINTNNLSHPQIIEKYGVDIQQYGILEKDDFREFLKKDFHLGYQDFISRNGIESLKLYSAGDEAGRKILRDKFLSYLITTEWSYNTLTVDHVQAVDWLGVSVDDLEWLFKNDLKSLSFQGFIDKHGLACITVPWMNSERAPFIPGSEASNLLKEKMLTHLEEQDIGVVALTDSYPGVWTALGISAEERALSVIDKQVNKLLNGTLSYSAFIEQNGAATLKHVLKAHNEIRKKLCEELEQETRNLTDVFSVYGEAMQQLSVRKEVVSNIILPKQITRLDKEELNYLTFRSENIWPQIEIFLKTHAEYKETLKKHFCQLPYPTMIGSNYSFDRASLEVREEEIEEATINDLRSTENYQEWIDKHTIDVLSLKDNRLEVKRALCSMLKKNGPEATFNYTAHFSLLNTSVKEMLFERWNTMSLDTIVSDENELNIFVQTMGANAFLPEEWLQYNKLFEPKEWTQKVLSDTQSMSIREIVMSYEDLFNIGILVKSDIQYKLESELSNYQTLSNIDELYLDKLFNYHLVSRDTFALQHLSKQYLKTKNILEYPWSNDATWKMIDKYKLLPDSIANKVIYFGGLIQTANTNLATMTNDIKEAQIIDQSTKENISVLTKNSSRPKSILTVLSETPLGKTVTNALKKSSQRKSDTNHQKLINTDRKDIEDLKKNTDLEFKEFLKKI